MLTKPKPDLWDELGITGCFSWENEAQFLLDTLQIVKPKNILETGFFAGASSFMWLYLSKAKLTSIDPLENLYDPNTKFDGRPENVEKLQKAFPDRFTFLKKDSCLARPDLVGQKFDLFFIDGDHWEKGIRNDFQLALDLDIDWILVDDFVTSVFYMYVTEFSQYFIPIRRYDRPKAIFEGKPIPIYLMCRVDKDLRNKLYVE